MSLDDRGKAFGSIVSRHERISGDDHRAIGAIEAAFVAVDPPFDHLLAVGGHEQHGLGRAFGLFAEVLGDAVAVGDREDHALVGVDQLEEIAIGLAALGEVSRETSGAAG